MSERNLGRQFTLHHERKGNIESITAHNMSGEQVRAFEWNRNSGILRNIEGSSGVANHMWDLASQRTKEAGLKPVKQAWYKYDKVDEWARTQKEKTLKRTKGKSTGHTTIPTDSMLGKKAAEERSPWIKEQRNYRRTKQYKQIQAGEAFAKDIKWPTKCADCNYFREKYEERVGRPVREHEEYPGWDLDWAHSHRR